MKQLRHELKHWLALVILLLAGTTMAMATEVKVNEGTDNEGRLPVYGIYAGAYQKCEFVMESSLLEGMEGVKINKLTFFIQSSSQRVYIGKTKVFMKEVPFTEYTTTTYAGEEGASIVYEGSLDATRDKLVINLTTPYEYKGGNLLIGMYVLETTLEGGTFRVYGTKTSRYTGIASYSFDSYAEVDNPNMKELVKFLPTMLMDLENAPHSITYNDHDGKVSMTFAGCDDENNAKLGDEITATATVESGFALNNVHAESDVTITDNGDGTYSFTMPNHSTYIESELLRDIAVKVDVTKPLPLAEGEPLRFATTDAVSFELKDVIGDPAKAMTEDTHYTVTFDKTPSGVGKYVATFTGKPEGGYINSFTKEVNIQTKHTVPVKSHQFGTQFWSVALETFDDIDLATVTSVAADGKAGITKLDGTKVAANYPFLIYNPWDEEDGIEEFDLWEVIDTDVAISNPTPAAEFTGTDAAKSFTAAEMATKDFYVLQNGREFVYVILNSDPDKNVKPEHRCWIQLPKASGARILTIAMDETTGISDLKAAQSIDGIYDMQGRKMNTMPTQRGLYVIDGKKVVVK